MEDPCIEVAKEDVEGTLPELIIRGLAKETWGRKWQPNPVLAGEPGGLQSRGLHRVRHD